MRKGKKENGSETQHANFWKPNGALGFTCEFGCFSIASDKKHPSKNTRSYKKMVTSPILSPLKHSA